MACPNQSSSQGHSVISLELSQGSPANIYLYSIVHAARQHTGKRFTASPYRTLRYSNYFIDLEPGLPGYLTLRL